MSDKGITLADRSEPFSDADPPPPKARPKLVCVNGKVVGDAVVIVSERDPNWWRGMAVRRNGEIRLNGGRRL